MTEDRAQHEQRAAENEVDASELVVSDEHERREGRRAPRSTHPHTSLPQTARAAYDDLKDALADFAAAHGIIHDSRSGWSRAIDAVFLWIGIIAATLLVLLLTQQAIIGGLGNIWFVIPIYVLLAYLILPRLHGALSSIYLPDYFIGRTRTREGLLGDPVNLALNGPENSVHATMRAAGWTMADEISPRSTWGIIVSTLFRRSYPEAPVSDLYLFGRRHDFAYQREVDGNPAKRHHVRFWRTPEGWLLPGGHRVDWIGAGTFDTAVGVSLFTLQVTHRIDQDTDAERDFILATIAESGVAASVRVIEQFSSGYHSRNGGGDAIRTDGDLPIVQVHEVPGLPNTSYEVQHADANRRRAPLGTLLGAALVFARSGAWLILGLTLGLGIWDQASTAGAQVLDALAALDAADASSLLGLVQSIPVLLVFLALAIVPIVLAVSIMRGSNAARVFAMLISSATLVYMIASTALGTATESFGGIVAFALEIGVLLALSGPDARVYARGARNENPARSDPERSGEAEPTADPSSTSETSTAN
ncbi:LssY C-terminal domain-containing protein [Humidisolicoccus flavus]|uniref:LssY C-terminal domain-containing protein n=1 Tax=Humidisolicoccus flavus TaxID=3111414 RepID=UPI00325144C1